MQWGRGNPEGNNLWPGTMVIETSPEQNETFSSWIEVLQETGYQLQEEMCKSGTFKYVATIARVCLVKVNSKPDQKKNIRIHPTKKQQM